MALQIWLLNPYQLHFNWAELCSQVSTLIKPAVKSYDSNSKNKTKLGSVVVTNRYTKPPITARDLAIYVVPTPLYGFIGTDFGQSGHRKDAAGLTSTSSGGQSCSEAYVGDKEIVGTDGEFIRVDTLERNPKGVFVERKASPVFLAKVIYHELMHYVTPTWSEEKLHFHQGGSLAKTGTTEHIQQSEVDIKILADNLTKHGQSFWTGAWEAMRGRGYKV